MGQNKDFVQQNESVCFCWNKACYLFEQITSPICFVPDKLFLFEQTHAEQVLFDLLLPRAHCVVSLLASAGDGGGAAAGAMALIVRGEKVS